MFRTIVIAAVVFLSPTLFAQTHQGVSQNRTLYGKDVFVDQAVTGFFGTVSKSGNPEEVGALSATWKGFGVRNGIGMELFRFTQISINHTLLNLRAKSSSLEHLNGSELSATLAFAFSSPIGNLTFGTSLLGSSLSYQNYDRSSTFVGSGSSYSVGLNYFLSNTISIMGKAERNFGNLSHNGGNSGVDSLTLRADGFGVGVMIWL